MSEQRKQVWINRFQTKLFIRIGIYWLIYQLTVWNFLFIGKLLQEGPIDPLVVLNHLFHEHWPTLVCFVVLVPFLAWDAVKFTHRLVGPLYRFQRAIHDLTEGQNVKAIKLREGDFLVELQDDFNQMLESVQGLAATTPTGEGSGEPAGAASHSVRVGQ